MNYLSQGFNSKYLKYVSGDFARFAAAFTITFTSNFTGTIRVRSNKHSSYSTYNDYFKINNTDLINPNNVDTNITDRIGTVKSGDTVSYHKNPYYLCTVVTFSAE